MSKEKTREILDKMRKHLESTGLLKPEYKPEEIPNMPTPFFEPLKSIKKDAIEEEKRDIAEERQKKLDDIPF